MDQLVNKNVNFVINYEADSVAFSTSIYKVAPLP